MALTNASRLADFGTGIGTQGAILQVDNADQMVGIGTTDPTAQLEVKQDFKVGGASTITGALTVSGDLTASGNVTIGGTLTYEDVTNIDSVGIVTARAGVNVSGGQLQVGVAYSVGNAGVCTAAGFVGPLTGAVTGTASNASNASGATGDFSIADKIVHTGDTNTLIRFPAAGTIRFDTDGDERLRIESGGDVGINTDNPTVKLDISEDRVAFPSAAGSTILRLRNSAGSATLSIDSAANSNSVIQFGDTAAASVGTIQYSHVTNHLQFNTNGDGEKVRITSGGQLIAGGASSADSSALINIIKDTTEVLADNEPLYNNASPAFLTVYNSNNTGSGEEAGINIVPAGSANGAISIYGKKTGSYAGDLIFRFRSGASTSAERLRITSAGAVGIGTAIPNGDLDIVDDDASARIYLRSGNSDDASIYFGRMNDSATAAIRNDHSDNSFRFYGYNNSERMRITSDGFVQVGDGTVAAEAPLHVTAENSQGINAIFGAKDFIVDDQYNYDDANIALQGRDASDNETGAGVQFTVRNTGNNNWLHGAFVLDRDSNYHLYRGVGNTDGTKELTINSTGGVGIGTTNFASDLDNRPGLAIHSDHNDSCRLMLSTPTKSPTRLGYFGLNRFGMDVYNGFQIRDSADSYATRFIINNNGYIGINNDSPDRFLSINQGTSESLGVKQYNDEVSLFTTCLGTDATHGRAVEFNATRVDSGTLPTLRLGGQGGVLICVDANSTRMTVDTSGNIGAPSGNNIYNASDERLKENIVELTDGLSKVKQLKPVSFTWKDGWSESLEGVTQYGFGAQTTQAVDELLVEPFSSGDVELNGETIENPLRVNEKHIIPLLVKAVQELSAENTALKARLDAAGL